MKNIIIVVLISLVMTNCTLPPKPLDDEAESQRVNLDLVCAKQIDVQPISINGARPPKASFALSMKKLKKYTTDNIVIHKVINLTIPKQSINRFIHHFSDHGKDSSLAGYLSPQVKQSFDDSLKKLPKKQTSIVLFYTPLLHWSESDESDVLRGIAFQNSAYQPINVVAYNETRINEAPVISNTQSWKIVLTHELGHRLGIPADRSHNKAAHCTRRECNLYSSPDWQAVVAVLTNGMPYDYCKVCQAELLKAKKSCSITDKL